MQRVIVQFENYFPEVEIRQPDSLDFHSKKAAEKWISAVTKLKLKSHSLGERRIEKCRIIE